jgi:hypothetical protein
MQSEYRVNLVGFKYRAKQDFLCEHKPKLLPGVTSTPPPAGALAEAIVQYGESRIFA